MPHYTPLIATIVAGLVLAFIFGSIAHRLRISPLVGYLLAGVLAGPHTPGFVADQALATELAELGVILLMFGVGLHFSVADLMAVRRIVLVGPVAQIAVATAIAGGGDAVTMAVSRRQFDNARGELPPEVRVVDGVAHAAVAVLVADAVDDTATQDLRTLTRDHHPRLMMIVTAVDDAALVAAAEAGASGLLRRGDATPDVLVRTILKVAAGEGEVPPDLLGRLLEQVGRLQRQVLAPRGLTFSGLTPREAEVVRLVADGLDTREIALRMSYSERTVKNVLHDLTTRLQLRNRTHAVAYAVREGLI